MASDIKQTTKEKPNSADAPAKAGGRNKDKADASVPAPSATEMPGAAGETGVVPAEGKPARIKVARTVSVGVAHINASFNNTQVSIADMKGQVLAWSSAGRMGFRGTRKSTAYAATMVAQEVARQVSPYRMQEIEVRVQGPGSGRESAVRALQSAGLTITVIRDVTPIPHNGCRARKRRRV